MRHAYYLVELAIHKLYSSVNEANRKKKQKDSFITLSGTNLCFKSFPLAFLKWEEDCSEHNVGVTLEDLKFKKSKKV